MSLRSTQDAARTAAAPQFQAPKRKRKWPRRVLILLLVLAVAGVVLFYLTRSAKKTVSADYLPAQAALRELTVTVTGTGTVSPNDSYRATTLLRGEIVSAPFEEGDLVEKDQILFTLDSTDAEHNIRSAQSGVTRAELSLEQAQLSLRSLQKTQRDNERDLRIKANAAGTVTKLYVKEGDTVAAGTPIADILDRDVMELAVPFHAVHAAGFTPGQAAQVTVTGSSDVLAGTVKEVSPADTVAAGGAVVRTVTIRVPNPGALAAGATASALIGDVASANLGSFQYAASKQVTALASGKLETLSVAEGDRVADKEVLGSFELPDLTEQLENAELAVRSAQLALTDAQNALDIAQDALDDYTIKSPIAGTVIEKNYKEGDNVDASTAAASGASAYLAIVYDLSRLTFDMNVSELDVSRLKVGQTVTFTADALEGAAFTGHVDKININGVTLNGVTNYPVTVVVDGGEGLYPGMNVSATILVEELGNVLTLPVDAIQRGNTVYVAAPDALNSKGELVDPTKLEKREVELGRNDSDYIEILSGLSDGDTVYVPNAASDPMQMMMQMMGG